ncbi:hypothetical protein [Streptomyces sp. NPDC005485]|uniref:hypothetical protein n=1 Tax=Streptomyces sp. NPDC005485 TaxID=3155591 RepID=UPI0033B2E502
MKKRFMAAVTAGVAVAAVVLVPGAAHAADNDRLVTSTEGAAIGLTVDWTSYNSLVLRDVYLKDTGDDGHSVFFYVTATRSFQYPNHWNKSGYNTTAHWDALPGSLTSEIAFVDVTVCRDKLFDNCATSRQSKNPYVF